MLKRVTSGGAHLLGLAPGQYTVPDLTGPEIELQTSRIAMSFKFATRVIYKAKTYKNVMVDLKDLFTKVMSMQ